MSPWAPPPPPRFPRIRSVAEDAWPPHPDDEFVEITAYGDPVRRRTLARSGSRQAVEDARADYVAGRIEVEEFERRVGAALGLPIRVAVVP